MFGLGLPELLVILVIALLVFGVDRLPDIGSGLGKAIRGFKDAADEARSKGPTPVAGPHCPHCGAAYQGEAKFCPHCGKSLAAEPGPSQGTPGPS